MLPRLLAVFAAVLAGTQTASATTCKDQCALLQSKQPWPDCAAQCTSTPKMCVGICGFNVAGLQARDKNFKFTRSQVGAIKQCTSTACNFNKPKAYYGKAAPIYRPARRKSYYAEPRARYDAAAKQFGEGIAAIIGIIGEAIMGGAEVAEVGAVAAEGAEMAGEVSEIAGEVGGLTEGGAEGFVDSAEGLRPGEAGLENGASEMGARDVQEITMEELARGGSPQEISERIANRMAGEISGDIDVPGLEEESGSIISEGERPAEVGADSGWYEPRDIQSVMQEAMAEGGSPQEITQRITERMTEIAQEAAQPRFGAAGVGGKNLNWDDMRVVITDPSSILSNTLPYGIGPVLPPRDSIVPYTGVNTGPGPIERTSGVDEDEFPYVEPIIGTAIPPKARYGDEGQRQNNAKFQRRLRKNRNNLHKKYEDEW